MIFFWLPIQRAADLTAADKRERPAFCTKYANMSPANLKRAMGFVLDEKVYNAALTKAEGFTYAEKGSQNVAKTVR